MGAISRFGALVAGLVTLSAVAVALWAAFWIGAYSLADFQWEKCQQQLTGQTRTREDVESCLFWYTTSECQWSAYDGREKLWTNGGCISYDILGHDSIEVSYDAKWVAVRMYPAYE